jgi:hypothetical protein
VNLMELFRPYLEANDFFPMFVAAEPHTDRDVMVVLMYKDQKFEIYGFGQIIISPKNLRPNDLYLKRAVDLLVERRPLYGVESEVLTQVCKVVKAYNLHTTKEYGGFLKHFYGKVS